jgi:hypothetical protein
MFSTESWDIITILIGGIATLAIYSFLVKENPFYRFFEHLFIGIAAGYGPVFTVKRFLWPEILEPMLGLNRVLYPDGTFSHEYNGYYIIYIIPMMFGLLYYTLYTKRFSWMVKLVIGFSLGVSAGLAFKGFFAEMVPQFVSSFKPLLVFNGPYFDWSQSIFNIIFIFTLLAVMYYFFFTFKTESRATEHFSSSGRWLMMICFGAFFGSTVMARMALLVERLQFLLTDWWDAVSGVFL